MPAIVTKQFKKETETCPVCGSLDISIFIEIPQVPVYCNVLWSTREAAIHATRADLRLGFCRTCGHIYNYAFNPANMDYTLDYENSLHFSPRFQEYARSLAARLIKRHNLYGKDIIEIGCGSGDFLKLLCDAGGTKGVGFDPSFDPKRSNVADDSRITFIRDFYSERYAHYTADLICSRHVLEHMQSPREFLISVRQTIGHRSDTILFFEVPNALFTLKDLGIWDLLYEHCSYFSPNSFLRVFCSSGFEVFDFHEVFGSQFLCIEAKPGKDGNASEQFRKDDTAEIETYVSAFEKNYTSKLDIWKQKLNETVNQGKRVVIWGGGSKGVTFANVLRTESQIDYIVDINPHKHWKYVPGTGQRIVPPEYIQKYNPDLIIVMNPVYFQEIQQKTITMNVTAQVVMA